MSRPAAWRVPPGQAARLRSAVTRTTRAMPANDGEGPRIREGEEQGEEEHGQRGGRVLEGEAVEAGGRAARRGRSARTRGRRRGVSSVVDTTARPGPTAPAPASPPGATARRARCATPSARAARAAPTSRGVLDARRHERRLSPRAEAQSQDAPRAGAVEVGHGHVRAPSVATTAAPARRAARARTGRPPRPRRRGAVPSSDVGPVRQEVARRPPQRGRRRTTRGRRGWSSASTSSCDSA